MKSLIMSLFLLTSAGGSALGMLVAPLARDPYLVGLYLTFAALCFGSGVLFWNLFKGYDRTNSKENGVELRNLD